MSISVLIVGLVGLSGLLWLMKRENKRAKAAYIQQLREKGQLMDDDPLTAEAEWLLFQLPEDKREDAIRFIKQLAQKEKDK